MAEWTGARWLPALVFCDVFVSFCTDVSTGLGKPMLLSMHEWFCSVIYVCIFWSEILWTISFEDLYCVELNKLIPGKNIVIVCILFFSPSSEADFRSSIWDISQIRTLLDKRVKHLGGFVNTVTTCSSLVGEVFPAHIYSGCFAASGCCFPGSGVTLVTWLTCHRSLGGFVLPFEKP